MKNLLIGLFVLGLTSLGFSQNTNIEIEELNLDDVAISNTNFNYLEKVQDIALPVSVTSLENDASVFNVRGLPEFDGRKDPFRVTFKGNKGHIIADYDRYGKIVKSSERYDNIALPVDLVKAVLIQYPKSTFLKVAYSVDYEDSKSVEKFYKVQISKDGKIRDLKIKPGGILNNALAKSSKK